MNRFAVKLYFKSLVLTLSLGLMVSCTEEEPFFPIDPTALSVVAVQVNNSSIEDGRTGVKIDAAFTLILSSPVNPAVTQSGITLKAGAENIPLNISFNDNNSIVAITPVDSLDYETGFEFSLAAGELGINGESLASPFLLSFTTEIEPKPLFASGTGTESDPYILDSPEQVDLIRLFLDKYFVVATDIDVSSVYAADPLGWNPIGTLDEAFSGVIDGGGFTISGVGISRPEESEVGLFGVLSGGTIKNLNVMVTGVEGAQATAALLGRQLDGVVENCHTSGSITSTSSRAGGLVGSQEAGLISASSSSCGVFGTSSRIGGLVGLSQAGTISESFASGNCESLSSRVGGLVGSLEADASVNDSYATGNVTGKNRVGGAIGRLDGSFVRGYTTGNVTVTDADESGDYPGNIIGQVGSGSAVNNLYYPSDQTINYSGNADVTTDGTPVTIGSISCTDPGAILPGFDFSTLWACAGDGLWPLLSWQ